MCRLTYTESHTFAAHYPIGAFLMMLPACQSVFVEPAQRWPNHNPAMLNDSGKLQEIEGQIFQGQLALSEFWSQSFL